MSNFNESDYQVAGMITAYDIIDVSFVHPLSVMQRYVSLVDFSPTLSRGYQLPLRKSEGATVSEKQERGSAGITYKVTIEFTLQYLSANELAQLNSLRTPHHLVMTHINGSQSLVRCTDTGWQFNMEGDKATITVHNTNGQQRVI